MGATFSHPLNDVVFPKSRPGHDEKALRDGGFEAPAHGHYALRRNGEATPGSATLVCFHGNLETTSTSLGRWNFAIQQFRGDALVGFEYPGYGLRAAESVSQDAILAEIPEWLKILEKYDRKENLFVCGRSLGTFFALRFAISLRRKCKGVILISPMLTAAATKIAAPWYYLAATVDLLDNESAAKRLSVDVPVLIVHGEEDSVVPAWNSEKLYRTFKDLGHDVTRKTIPNKGHNDLYGDVDAHVSQFIKKHR